MLLINLMGDEMKTLLGREGGQGLVEYALILVLISIVSILIMTSVGTDIQAVFSSAAAALT